MSMRFVKSFGAAVAISTMALTLSARPASATGADAISGVTRGVCILAAVSVANTVEDPGSALTAPETCTQMLGG